MKKTFILATTGNRATSAIMLVQTLQKYLNNGWKIAVCAQEYSDSEVQALRTLIGNNGDVVVFDYLVGAHSAKAFILNNFSSDIWCSIDDDMEITEKTDYDRIAEILMEKKHIGFVSGNWGRTIHQVDKKVPEDVLVKQKLVYTGGGLLFRDDVAEIIRKIPDEKYLFDDCLWSMYAYINGYENYRYMGSVAIHHICTKGGRKTWIKQNDGFVLPPKKYLVARECSDEEGYHICVDKDLTDLAKRMHEENLK